MKFLSMVHIVWNSNRTFSSDLIVCLFDCLIVCLFDCLFVCLFVFVSYLSLSYLDPIWRHFTQCTDSKLTQNRANMSMFETAKYWLARGNWMYWLEQRRCGCFGQQLERGRGHIGQHSRGGRQKGVAAPQLSSLSQNILTDTHRHTQTHTHPHTHTQRKGCQL